MDSSLLNLYTGFRLEEKHVYKFIEFHELQQIVESTARSLQALSDYVAEMRLNIDGFVSESREAARVAQQERAELRVATLRVTALTEGIANLVVSLDEDRPTILGRRSPD